MARTVCVGASGNGKSWEMGRYIESVVPKFSYGVHFDIENEEAGLAAQSPSGEPPVFNTFYVDEAGYAGEWDIPLTIRQNPKLRIVPDGLTDEEMTKLFALVCAVGMELTKQDDVTFHISVDEAHNVIPKAGVHSKISRMLTGGRKRGLEWCISTQRMQNLHENALGQASMGVYFGMAGRDAGKVDNYTTFNARSELPQLEKYECLYENRDTGEWWRVDTTEKSREHPHMAADDGLADEFIESQQTEA